MDSHPGKQSPLPGTNSQTIEEGKLFAAVGYFSFLCFVPLLWKRDNRFAQFHGRQGLILFVVELAASMLTVIPVLGNAIFMIFWVFIGLLSLISIVKVLKNEYWQIPIVFQIASKITF
jgi:fumarate reductase subunit D